jgi:hypothetical protein
MPDEPRELSELTLEIAATLFAGTVLQLATTDGTLRDRLCDAYGGITMEVMRFADQLPPSFGPRVIGLHDHLTGGTGAVDDEGRTALARMLTTLTGSELTDAARRICFLADDLNLAAVRYTPDEPEDSSTDWVGDLPVD